MKKLLIIAIAGFVFSCASTGQSSNASGMVDLDTAISMAGTDIQNSLNSGTKVALLNFTSGSNTFSDYVLEELSISLVKGRKLIVVDRKEIDLIRGEMNFQMSGEVSDESAQEIGKLLGAQSIISGSITSMGETHRFRTKVLNVNSAVIETSSSFSVKDDPVIQHLLASSSGGSAQRPAVAAAQPTSAQGDSSTLVQTQPTAPAEPALRTYRIGETGPAGGFIFYDKGNNSGGWRYLEAAPEELEFQTIWSVHRTQVENTHTTIGSGRRNTQLIVEKFKLTSGEWDTAAQKVDDLIFNGFDDWFLPSKDELDQMYGNLKRRNLGSIKNELYWSSTQTTYNFQNDGGAVQNFTNGQMGNQLKNYKCFVRPIRQVPGPNTTSSAADPGGTGTATNKKSGTSWLYSVLGFLLLGGFVAYIIWTAPSQSAAPPAIGLDSLV